MVQTRLFCRAVVLAFFAAVATLIPQAGRAAIVENIFEHETQNLLGTISFPAISGDNAAGVDLSFLSFGPISGLPPFTEADITVIHWVLNPIDFTVLDLFLNAFQGDNPCPDGVPCANNQLQLFTSGFPGTETGYQFDETGTACTEADGCIISDLFPTDVEFRVAIPEPGGLAILVVGLIGMGIILWRRRRKGQLRTIHIVAD
jgi:hypothetical protein